ncbi:MAG: VTT domain-containing protein [Candidatus Woesearchaeota archaeon]
MGIFQLLIDYVLHLDRYVSQLIEYFGPWTYVVVFLIIFLETGLVLTPFLPGDSLIFALGAFAAIGSLNIWLLFILLSLAAILGDTMNYWIGHYLGRKILRARPQFMKRYEIDIRGIKRDSHVVIRLRYFMNIRNVIIRSMIYRIYKHIINAKNISITKKFFIKHGGKTIILARFIPIIRTFAPFLAGIGKMDYWKFFMYNVVGGIVWVGLFLWVGYFFGNISWVQENFSIVIIIIMATSLIPVITAIITNLRDKRKK